MPWQLTTPVTVGDLDSSSYTQVKIVDTAHRSRNVRKVVLMLEYGNTVDGEWVRGHLPSEKKGDYTIFGDEYDTLVSTHTSLDGELSYIASKRGLYEHLLAMGVIGPGVMV